MAHARIVQAIGNIDGANRVFLTPVPYVPGSTAYILNGTIHSHAVPQGPDNDFGYVESDPDGGKVTVDNAPLDGDVVQIFFWDRLIEPASPIDIIVARLIDDSRLVGIVRPVPLAMLTGTLRTPKVIGVVSEPTPDRVIGIDKLSRIIGVVKDGC